MNKITKIAIMALNLTTVGYADTSKADIAKFMARSEMVSKKDNEYISKVVKLNKITCVEEFWKKGVSPKAFKIINRQSCKIILFKNNGEKCINIQPK